MRRTPPKQPFYRRSRKKKRGNNQESFWSTYLIGPLKKAWESMVVKIVTGVLLLVSGPLYYNFFQNPVVNFPIKVEVLDEGTRRGVENAEIYVQDTPYHFTTNADGIGQMIIRVREKRESILLTCTSDQHQTQQKKIDVPETKGPKPEFYTTFVLVSSDLQ